MGLNPTHYGVDIDSLAGVGNVRAAMGGEVVYVGGYKEPDEIGSAGTVVSIIGDDGFGYLYARAAPLDSSIREGARIPAGCPIGLSGKSGFENINATPHTHFEMLWGESREALFHALRPPWFDEAHETPAFRINPLPYLFGWFEEYLASGR